MDSQLAEKLRTHVSTPLQKATPWKCNLPGHLRKVVGTLRGDGSIVIVLADKGNSTVVMDRSEYDQKLNIMLSDNTYRKLKKDPTAKTERQVAKAVRRRLRIKESCPGKEDLF